jgi:3,5-epimerase/4-reductase
MRVLIYGHKGWIGSQFLDLLTADADIEVLYPTSRAEDIDGIERDVVEQQLTHVVSFIGRTHGVVDNRKFSTIDYLEQPGKLQENLRDNLFAPMAVALLDLS